MAELSKLSIGVLCGGSALFIIILVGFIVWKIKYDRSSTSAQTKRKASPRQNFPNTQHSSDPEIDITMHGVEALHDARPGSAHYYDIDQATVGSENDPSNSNTMASFSPSDSTQPNMGNDSSSSSSAMLQNLEQNKLAEDLIYRLESKPGPGSVPDNTETDTQHVHSEKILDVDSPSLYKLAREAQIKTNEGQENNSATCYSLASPVAENSSATCYSIASPVAENSSATCYSIASPVAETDVSESIADGDEEPKDITLGKQNHYFELEAEMENEIKEN